MAVPRIRLQRFVLWLLLWGGLGLFFASEAAIRQYPGRDRAMPWGDALLVNIPFYLLWGVLALGVLRVCAAVPITGDRRRRARAIALHLVVGVAVASLQLVLAECIFVAVRHLRGHEVPFAAALAFSFRHNFHINLLTYWGIVAIRHLREYDRGLRERELTASRLEEQLAHAELAALRMQMQPHFLFNALNSISELVYDQPEVADRMLVRLSDLLRQSLESGGRQEVELERELDFVGTYLDLERMRFPDRLEVTLEIEPATRVAAVPAFVLQPLVENAVRHGVGRSAVPCHVAVRARRESDELVLEVENELPVGDSGTPAGGAGPTAGRAGLGLQNTRARLAQLYGAEAGLEVAFGAGGADGAAPAALARVRLPWREPGAESSVS
jgi:two-component system LytT family sensor kinase